MADSVEKVPEGVQKEPEQDNTHKRKEISSISDIDTSGATIPSPSTGILSKTQRKKLKKKKDEDSAKEQGTAEEADKNPSLDISKQLAEINKKLNNVMTKDDINKKLANVITKDDGFLKGIIREIFQEMKDDLEFSVQQIRNS